jgi:very-short-patch-repair endonuclease
LLIFENNKIIVEYDGFKEHFDSDEDVNISNYKYYLKGDDIYRQKVIEGYGYHFLRINKFNLGKDPVETLNSRITELLKKNSKIQ